MATPQSIRTFLYSLCLLTSAVPVCHAGTPDQPAKADLLKFLIEQNSAAREKIHTVSYSIEIENSKSGKEVSKSSGEVKRRGKWFWSVYRQPGLNKTGGKVQERGSRVVVNDKYAAQWPMEGGGMAYQNDHSSIESMDPKLASKIAHNTPFDFTVYCFGDALNSFETAIKVNPDSIKWDAIETKNAQGKTVYQIRRFMPTMDDKTKPDAIWVLDPGAGFLAVEMSSFMADGSPWMHRAMKATEILPGVWFPVEYQQETYGQGRTPTANIATRHVTLKNVKINEPIAPEQFEIDALHLSEQPGVTVARTNLKGEINTYVYMGKALLPQPIVEIAKSIDSKAHVDEALSHTPVPKNNPPPDSPKQENSKWPIFLLGAGLLLVTAVIVVIQRQTTKTGK